MRRKDKMINSQNIINDILINSYICNVALFNLEYPYVVPLNYGYDGKNLFFHCATEGKKINLIQENNKVGFVIKHDHEVLKSDNSCQWTTKYRSIMGTGKIEIITEPEEKRKGMDIIMKHHGKMENSYSDSAIDKILVLKLVINELTAKQSGVW